MCVTKYIQDLYIENHKTLLRESKNSQKTGRYIMYINWEFNKDVNSS